MSQSCLSDSNIMDIASRQLYMHGISKCVNDSMYFSSAFSTADSDALVLGFFLAFNSPFWDSCAGLVCNRRSATATGAVVNGHSAVRQRPACVSLFNSVLR